MRNDFLEIIAPIFIIPILLFLLKRVGVKKLSNYHSPLLGTIKVLEKYNKEKVLEINNYPQGISTEDKSIDKSYWYKVAKEAVKVCKGRANPKILMLGLGANTITNIIAKLNPKIHITIVEIDEFIIQACKEHFNLEKLPNYKLIKGDAFKILLQPKTYNLPPEFDVIVVDIFTGEPPYIDFKSNEDPFIKKLIPHLKKDGALIFNRPAHLQSLRESGQKFKDYLLTYFKKAEVFDIKDPRGFRNFVITASKPI